MSNILARGTLYIMGAQFVFLMSNYAIHFWLGRTLRPDIYGSCGIVLYFIVLLRIPLESGTMKAVSRYTAEKGRSASFIRKQAMKFQFPFAAALFVSLFFAIPNITRALKDPDLTIYLRFAALCIPLLAGSAIYVGSLNGLRTFEEQAKASIANSIVKVTAALVLVSAGYKIYGLVGAYILASLVGLMTARHYCAAKKVGKKDDVTVKDIALFASPIIFFTSFLILVASLDLFFIKALLPDKAQAGFYTSASVLSKIPYFVLSAFSITLFPSIARSSSDEEHVELTRKYIKQSLRYLSMIVIPMAVIIHATSRELVTFVYTKTYLAAALPLSILVFGFTFFSFFFILTTIINASGRPLISLGIVLAMLFMDITLNLSLIPVYGLAGAAFSTSITALAGVVMAAAIVYGYFKTLFVFSSLWKIVLASASVYCIARVVHASGFLLLWLYCALFLLYIAFLLLLREIKKEDFQVIRGIIEET